MTDNLMMNLWIAFNVIFGLFTLRNFVIRLYATVNRRAYRQSELGYILDMVVMSSCLAFVLEFYVS